MQLFAGGAIQKVALNGGTFKCEHGAHCISLNGSKSAASRGEKLELLINGCYLTSNSGIILLNPNIKEDWNSYYIHFENGTLRTTGDGFSGAIENGYSVPEGVSAIRQAVQRDDIKVFTQKLTSDTNEERTHKQLIFKDGELISSTDNFDDSEEDNQKEPNLPNENESNKQNGNEVNSGEDNIQQNGETTTGKSPNEKVENNTKLPQTGEKTNMLAKWLSIFIGLSIFWLASMLLIDHVHKNNNK